MKIKVKSLENSTAHIHALTHDGRGIATIDNKKTFIDAALIDETIECKITEKRRSYNHAEIVSILSRSKDRIDPACAHYGICGGCNLQHMSVEAQIQFKQQLLLDQLRHFGKVEPEMILKPLSENSLGYRRKARLGVKYVFKKNKVVVGYREKSSRYLAILEHCHTLHPSVGEKLSDLSSLIASLKAFDKIPQIEVAIGDEDRALIFRHLENLEMEDKKKLISFGIHHDFHIYLQPNPPDPVSKLWPEDSQERLIYTLPDYQLSFSFHPLDFTQINLEMNRLMVKQAITLLDLDERDKVLDLFCGIGNFTLPIARYGCEVTGIEGNQEMIARANENAEKNGIKNANFYCANLFANSEHEPWMKNKFDKILLDPPRAGAQEILSQCKKIAAKKIVYVSCNPGTLARDAGELVHQQGYVLKQVGIINMFPHTAHIEAMAVFEIN